MTEIGIRKFRDADSQQCADLIKKSIRTMEGLNEAAKVFLQAKNIPSKVSEELGSYFTIVAEIKDKIVGTGSLDKNEIKRVYVDPLFQNNGIGKLIVSVLEKEALGRGISKILLQSSPNATSFYNRLGYQTLEEESFKRGEVEFIYINMFKNLR